MIPNKDIASTEVSHFKFGHAHFFARVTKACFFETLEEMISLNVSPSFLVIDFNLGLSMPLFDFIQKNIRHIKNELFTMNGCKMNNLSKQNFFKTIYQIIVTGKSSDLSGCNVRVDNKNSVPVIDFIFANKSKLSYVFDGIDELDGIRGKSLLDIAVTYDKAMWVKLLIETEPDSATKLEKLKTAFFEAFHSNHIECAEIILRSNVDVNIKDINGVTPLHFVANFSSCDLIKTVASKTSDINARDRFGRTAFHLAAKRINDAIEIFNTLLNYGASPLIKNNKMQSPLQILLDARESESGSLLSVLNSNICFLERVITSKCAVSALENESQLNQKKPNLKMGSRIKGAL